MNKTMVFGFLITMNGIFIHETHYLSAEVCSSTMAASQLKSWDALEIHHFQHILGLRINLNNILLQSGNIRNVVISALTTGIREFSDFSIPRSWGSPGNYPSFKQGKVSPRKPSLSRHPGGHIRFGTYGPPTSDLRFFPLSGLSGLEMVDAVGPNYRQQ